MSKHMQALAVVDPVLTALALGYKNASLVGTMLFPIVYVDKMTGKIPKFGKERFMEFQTLRAPGANSNRKPITPEDTTPISLQEHDIEEAVDYTEEKNAMFSRQKIAARNTQTIIMMRHERRVAALAQDLNNFPAGHKLTLSGTSQFTHASSDPIGVIEDAKETIRQKIGVDPNTMIIGHASYRVLRRHQQLIDLFKYTDRSILGVNHLKEAFEIPNIGIGSALTSSDAGVFSSIWGDSIVLAYVPTAERVEDRDVGEPSFAYTLRMRNHPWVDRYPDNGGKIEVVRCTDNLDERIVGSEAGYLLKDTNADS